MSIIFTCETFEHKGNYNADRCYYDRHRPLTGGTNQDGRFVRRVDIAVQAIPRRIKGDEPADGRVVVPRAEE